LGRGSIPKAHASEVDLTRLRVCGIIGGVRELGGFFVGNKGPQLTEIVCSLTKTVANGGRRAFGFDGLGWFNEGCPGI